MRVHLRSPSFHGSAAALVAAAGIFAISACDSCGEADENEVAEVGAFDDEQSLATAGGVRLVYRGRTYSPRPPPKTWAGASRS